MACTANGNAYPRRSYRKCGRGAQRGFSQHTVGSFVYQLLDTILRSLKQLDESDFAETANIYPQPYASYPDLNYADLPAFDLPSVLVAPEVIELDGLPAESEEEAQVKKEEWPEFLLRLFDSDVCCISVLLSPSTNFCFLVDHAQSQYPYRIHGALSACGHH